MKIQHARPRHGRLLSHTRTGRRRSLAALVMSLVAVVSITAAAAAEPPTPITRYGGTLTPLTLPLTAPDTTLSAPPRSAIAAPPAAAVDPGAAPIPTLGPRAQPAARAGVIVKAPKLRPSSTGHVLRGRASWYCNSDGSRAQLSVCHNSYPDTGGFNPYAAAGPKLRAALGSNWRGRVVSVDGVAVKLVDWCQCYEGQSNEKLIDLYYDVYRRTGGSVTIRW